MRRYRCPAKRRRPCPTSDVVARRARDEPPAPVSEKRRSKGSRLPFVRTGSEVGVDEGGRSPTRARARCACRSSRIRLAASTPATPAIAVKEGSRRAIAAADRQGVEMRTLEMRTFDCD